MTSTSKLRINITILLLLFSANCLAYNTVRIKGTIFESPCSISPDDAYQTIDMGIIPIKEIEKNGKSKTKNINIKLINCQLKNNQNNLIKITLYGMQNANNQLNKNGINLIIQDNNGSIIKSETTQYELPLSQRDMNISYDMYMIKSNKLIFSGDFNINLTMVVGYQ
ncbi:fimbrial protein [Providencia rettgeri]|uniref:fimbrial protein n=1 Tax=Providencia rettgeri TaxID=587 RepID=UPI00029C1A69|nr:fimbrial protein [Providencia rettgeri]EKT57789.1 fimbrial protein domain-containing protein [Providencia rettgeri Dmel1]